MKVKKLLKGLFPLVIIVMCSLVLFEVCYRFQLIDFYQTEFDFLNPQKDVEKAKTVFVLGDSFTASKDSYIEQLRDSFSEYQFINASVPGTGIKQHQLIFKNRQGAKGDVLLYQFYSGNDFLDLDYPFNFKSSIMKVIFKKLSEQFLSLHYLNYKLAYLRSNTQTFEQLNEYHFDTTLYNYRTKEQFITSPQYLQNTIQLKGKEAETYQVWRRKFQSIIEEFGVEKPIYLIVIPHVAQLNLTWLNRMKSLSAALNTAVLHSKYPLLEQLKKDFPQVKVISPLPVFKKQTEKGKELYFPNDPHLSATGQLVLGKLLVEKLKSDLTYGN